jgi:hypothetical protein
MGHSEQWQQGLEDADECEQSVYEALQRAKQGIATEEDWELIDWACGFSHRTKPIDRTVIDCTF